MVDLITFILVLVAAFLGALATLEIKLGVDKHSLREVIFTYHALKGFLFIVISMVLYIFALSKEELSVVYPLVSTTYIWTALFSVKYLGEKMNKWKWLGLIGVVIGVVLISIGS